MEVWKEIKGYEGFYEISNLGNVRSIDRIIKDKNGVRERFYKGVQINPLVGYGGYYVVQLRKNVKKGIFYVHRLVAEHFCGGEKEGLLVNHINENKLDNRAVNLEFVTKSQNTKHSNNGKITVRKFTRKQILDIRQRYSDGESLYKISKDLKENSGTLSNIVNGKTYKDII